MIVVQTRPMIAVKPVEVDMVSIVNDFIINIHFQLKILIAHVELVALADRLVSCKSILVYKL